MSTMIHEPHTLPSESEPQYSENDYRACAILFLSLVQPAIAHVMAAKNQEIGYCQLLFAFGLSSESMHDAAARLFVETACISKGAKEFVRENGLPTPACMKSDVAAARYSQSRRGKLS